MIQPKGAKVLVEEIVKENLGETTASGLVIPNKDKDSHDNALLKGKVLEVGTPEIDAQGIERKPDVKKGTIVWFNRYDSFIVLVKGMTKYWVVPCHSIFCVGEGL
jgi:co-chaperonin GroES (HSP10)